MYCLELIKAQFVLTCTARTRVSDFSKGNTPFAENHATALLHVVHVGTGTSAEVF